MEGDTNNDGNLDTDETWIYSASETAGEGLITNKGTVMGLTADGIVTMAMDPANYTGVNAPTGGIGFEGQAVCETEGKAEAMVFEYIPSTTFDTQQESKKGEGLINNGLDADGTSYFVVTDEDDVSKVRAGEGDIYFAGDVSVGERFTASRANAGDKFSSNTFFYMFDSQGGPLLQSARYHTSCSAPIILGDGIYSATLVGYDGEDGSLISIPVPPEPVTPIEPGPGAELPQVDDPFDPNNIGESADTPPGPVANPDDTVTFTYEVTNTGDVDLTITDLVDDNATPDDPSDDFTPTEVVGEDGFNFGDIADKGVFNPSEIWYFQSKEMAANAGSSTKNTNTIKVKANDAAGIMVMDDDPANYIINPLSIEKLVRVTPDFEMGDACEIAGKPEKLTFTFSQDPDAAGPIIDTNQKSGQVEFTNNNPQLDDDGEIFVVTNKDFSGTVSIGEEFTLDDVGGDLEIEIFDFQGGPLLQEISKYHLSCSQPIRVGDVLGSLTLTEFQGEDGTVSMPDPTFVDADTPATAPEAVIGTTVEFLYEVTNEGDIGLTDLNVTDDKLADLELVDQGNGDDILDPGEQWIYAASENATEGLQTNKATATANVHDVEVMDMDLANYVGVEMPPPAGDVCDIFGKVEALTFKYEPSTDVVTGQKSDKAGILAQNGVDDDGVSFVVVTDKEDASKALSGEGDQYFRGNVGFGEFFQADESIDNFGSNTYVHFFDDQNGPLLQTINYHTSCSQPIAIGDVVGNATLAEYFGEDGAFDNPSIVPVPGQF